LPSPVPSAGTAVAGALVAAAAVGAALVLWAALPAPAGGETASATRFPEANHAIAGPARTEQKVGDMNTRRMKRVAAFVGVGLPALVASAGQSADPQVEQAVSLCLAAPEKSLECKDEVVQAWIALRNPPERQRAKLRKKMLEALVASPGAQNLATCGARGASSWPPAPPPPGRRPPGARRPGRPCAGASPARTASAGPPASPS
jgi:hypothetical protein